MTSAKAARPTLGASLVKSGSGRQSCASAPAVDFGGDLPQRIPPRVPERRDVGAVGDVETAQRARVGDAFDFCDGRVDVVAGDAGEAGVAVGMGAAEARQPFVVDTQHFGGGLVVVDAHGGAEDAIEYFAVDAVALLILEAQVGVGEAADALAAVVVEPGRGHPIGAMDLAGNVLAARRAHAVHQAEVGPALGDPLLALGAVGDVRHPILQCGVRIGGEQIGREPDQINMAIGRDEFVPHPRNPLAKSCSSSIDARKPSTSGDGR